MDAADISGVLGLWEGNWMNEGVWPLLEYDWHGIIQNARGLFASDDRECLIGQRPRDIASTKRAARFYSGQ